MQQKRTEPQEKLLFPSEVALLFRVEVKTVTRWSDLGRITTVRTPGGHRRYIEKEILELRAGNRTQGQ